MTITFYRYHIFDEKNKFNRVKISDWTMTSKENLIEMNQKLKTGEWVIIKTEAKTEHYSFAVMD